MWVNEFDDIEDSESANSSAEVSEVFKESFKKWQAGTKRVQKDEKKSKRMDLLLAGFLEKILQDDEFNFLWNDILKLLDEGIPASFILWALSVIYSPISDKIRSLSEKEPLGFEFYRKQEIDFDDNNLDEPIRFRINAYFEDFSSVLSYEPSTLLTKRLILKIGDIEMVHFIAKIFATFLKTYKINISRSKAESYANFILTELQKILKQIHLEEV